MRHAFLVLMVAGCGFRSPGGEVVPDGGVPGMQNFGLPELRAGQLVDMTIDGPRSSLTPNAYTYGGLVAHGLKGVKLWSHGDTGWAKLAGVTASGAGLWAGEHIVNNAKLDYLGVTGTSVMTLWLEGEVWLDGTSTDMFHVNGDDVAFVEIAAPGSTAYMPVAENITASIPAQVAASGVGWYPIRVGFSNDGGAYDFLFARNVNGSDVAWTRERMRARTSELGGVLRTVFGKEILGGGLPLGGNQVAPPVLHFDQADLLAQSDFSSQSPGTPPQGTPTDDNHWSARYAGQVYIKKPGMYLLQTESDDGNRIRLADGHDDQAWDLGQGVGVNDAKTMAHGMLSTGWNDLTVDFNQAAGNANIRVRIQGLDFPTLVEIPRDQLRPVEPADDRLALGADDMSHNVPDNGGMGNDGTATMTVIGYAGSSGAAETVDSIELTYEVNSPHWDQIRVDLEAPPTSTGPGARVTIRDRDGNGGNGDRSVQFTVPSNATPPLSMLRSGLANGDWKLHVFDNVPGGQGNASSILSARLTLHTKGGPDKVAHTASWTSAVIDAQTPVFAVDRVTWNERALNGASKVAVRVQTCQQPDCSDGNWPPDPITQKTPFNVARGRYLQLRVDMTSDGTVEPELSGLFIAFRHD